MSRFIRTRLNLEALDSRVLPSITLPSNSNNGRLSVIGTDGYDIIVIERQPSTVDNVLVTIYDDLGNRRERRTIDHLASITDIFVDGGNNRDIIINWTDRPSTLMGGAGDDVLQGGFRNDTLDGGTGSDVFTFWNRPYGSSVRVNDLDPTWGEQLGSDVIREAGADAGAFDRDLISLYWLGAGAKLDLASTAAQTVASGRLTLTLDVARNGDNIESVSGTQFDDVLRGNLLNNGLFGEGGADILEGRGGNDGLSGGTENDTYVFGPAVLGFDTISEYSNSGIDTLDFATFSAGVTLDLGLTTRQEIRADQLALQLAGGGTTIHFENVIGSANADTIRGNGLANKISGLGNADILEGRGGNDYLDGGFGGDTYVFAGGPLGSDSVYEAPEDGARDTLDFAQFSVGVTLDLRVTAPQTMTGGMLTLTLSGPSGIVEPHIENVTGSGLIDTITGNSLNNLIDGGFQDDTLYGQGGSDTLYGGWGSDRLYGGTQDDFLYGFYPGNWQYVNAFLGSDTLDGEGGTDHHQAWIYIGQPNFWNAPNFWNS